MKQPPSSDLNGKSAERSYLRSIQGDIERVAKESRARDTLTASVEAKKRVEAEKRQRQKEKLARIAAELQREKDARHPDRDEQDNGPTRERRAKLAGLEEITPPIKDQQTRANTRAHLTQGVVEFYRNEWTYEELQGARHLISKWDAYAKALPSMTSNPEGVPGGSFGPRNGGLRGGERSTQAYQDVTVIEAIIFTNFGAKGLNLVKWFAWETLRVAREGAPVTEQMHAAGRALAPFVRSEDRLWGITFGSLQRIFHFAYAKWVASEEAMRRRDSTPAQVAMRRGQRMRRGNFTS